MIGKVIICIGIGAIGLAVAFLAYKVCDLEERTVLLAEEIVRRRNDEA